MKRINSFFEVIEDGNIFHGKQFTDCKNYSSFSIVYISQYNKYSTMINANCSGKDSIYFFLLSDECIMPSGKIEEDDDYSGDNDETNSPQTSEIQIITTQPIIKTTFPIIKTTSPQIITTHPIIKTTLPIIKTTSPQIFTTQPIIETSSPNRKSDKIDSSTESLCKEVGKKYVEGKCVCDTDNEYYNINSKNSENKCYKKNDLPKNSYYNNLTKVYELCYKTCETCIMGGDFSKNNCIECTLNFIKEPENEESNCVEKCKFLYYYNSLNQYSCTEDEQCPNGASLIIRNKKKMY
jgi:hypothetical protein